MGEYTILNDLNEIKKINNGRPHDKDGNKIDDILCHRIFNSTNFERFASEKDARETFLAECWQEEWDPRWHELDTLPIEILRKYVKWLFEKKS